MTKNRNWIRCHGKAKLTSDCGAGQKLTMCAWQEERAAAGERISQPAEEKPQGHGKERGKGTQEARSHLSHSEGNQKRRQGKQRKVIQKKSTEK